MRLTELSRWQWTTVFTLTIGYMGYYFCRSNLSIAGPLLLEEYAATGFDKESFGLIATVGVGFYTAGKLFNGILCDFIGGRRMFLFGMFASILFTLLFSFSNGMYFFAAFWAGNRLVQSGGWAGLIKTTSRWFPSSVIGSVLAIISMSYLFGDTISRLLLGQLMEMGLGWQQLFWVAASILGVIFLFSAIFLKNSPVDVGEEEPPANPLNLYGEEGNEAYAESLVELLRPYAVSPSFWIICFMSFGLTLIRETFNFWTPTYLTEVAQLAPGQAAFASGLFPFFGGISVLLVGFLSDRLTDGRRGMVMCAFLIPAAIILVVLSRLDETTSATIQLTLISLIGLLMIGPYSLLAGAISIDLGGKRGSSSASGIADSAGYLGGMVSGLGIGKIATLWGWTGAFTFLSAILVVSAGLAVVYWYIHEIHPARKIARDALAQQE